MALVLIYLEQNRTGYHNLIGPRRICKNCTTNEIEVTNEYTEHFDRSCCLSEPWRTACGICKVEGEQELTMTMEKEYSKNYDLDHDYYRILLT